MNQAADLLSRFVPEGIHKTLVNDDIPKPEVSLVQHTGYKKDEGDGNSADQYSACGSCDVILGKLQGNITDVVTIV